MGQREKLILIRRVLEGGDNCGEDAEEEDNRAKKILSERSRFSGNRYIPTKQKI